MILKIKHFVIFITIGIVFGCKDQPIKHVETEIQLLSIDSSAASIGTIDAFIEPFHNRINEVLDSTLAYAPKMLVKDDGPYNTSEGNLLADILISEANPVFESRTGHQIDFALLNHGGIRSIISKGKISARTAYEVMPFENAIAVVELTGKSVKKMVTFLVSSNSPHPISGMQIILFPSGELKSVQIQGKPIDPHRNYFVATSDFLVSGGDHMVFFKEAVNVTVLNYLIRNAFIDYFTKVDTLTAQVDNRFVKLK